MVLTEAYPLNDFGLLRHPQQPCLRYASMPIGGLYFFKQLLNFFLVCLVQFDGVFASSVAAGDERSMIWHVVGLVRGVPTGWLRAVAIVRVEPLGIQVLSELVVPLLLPDLQLADLFPPHEPTPYDSIEIPLLLS